MKLFFAVLIAVQSSRILFHKIPTIIKRFYIFFCLFSNTVALYFPNPLCCWWPFDLYADSLFSRSFVPSHEYMDLSPLLLSSYLRHHRAVLFSTMQGFYALSMWYFSLGHGFGKVKKF